MTINSMNNRIWVLQEHCYRCWYLQLGHFCCIFSVQNKMRSTYKWNKIHTYITWYMFSRLLIFFYTFLREIHANQSMNILFFSLGLHQPTVIQFDKLLSSFRFSHQCRLSSHSTCFFPDILFKRKYVNIQNQITIS